METTNYQGDLADIVRASGSAVGGTSSAEPPDWLFPSNPSNYSSRIDDFGDPFSVMGDPLLHDIDTPVPRLFNNSSNSIEILKTCADDTSAGGFLDHHDDMKRQSNIFSRMRDQISPNSKLQVSPCDSPMGLMSPPPPPPMLLLSNDQMISPNSLEAGCFVESPGLQISSPRNTGVKRRKSQAKKVVCIPAPAPANSRPSGEIVPSDLWAWRKYGQKPIKGSPYPRGYYRCSSSKGCSARKQVERSRTDPNMLVITYTSEHNHPWPTQRNALAGSTRSQPSKNSTSTPRNSSSSQAHKPSKNVDSATVDGKDEKHQDSSNQLEMDDAELNEEFPQSYKPALMDPNQSEDFFAELEELEANPLDLLLTTQGFSGAENKILNPFSIFSWTGHHSTMINNNPSHEEEEEEAKKDS